MSSLSLHFWFLSNVFLLQKLVYNGSEAREEFVETEYYKDLNCVDKHHHTVNSHPRNFPWQRFSSYFAIQPRKIED